MQINAYGLMCLDRLIWSLSLFHCTALFTNERIFVLRFYFYFEFCYADYKLFGRLCRSMIKHLWNISVVMRNPKNKCYAWIFTIIILAIWPISAWHSLLLSFLLAWITYRKNDFLISQIWAEKFLVFVHNRPIMYRISCYTMLLQHYYRFSRFATIIYYVSSFIFVTLTTTKLVEIKINFI